MKVIDKFSLIEVAGGSNGMPDGLTCGIAVATTALACGSTAVTGPIGAGTCAVSVAGLVGTAQALPVQGRRRMPALAGDALHGAFSRAIHLMLVCVNVLQLLN